ncbi:MAG: glycosyltransferase family 2 protein [Candidatus Nanopelagicaceae bacterium]
MNESAIDSPAVTVMIPVLNEADHLVAAVESVLAQDYSGDIEVILAVGPSKDGTDEIARSLARRDSRVIVVENPSGRTASALNRAIKSARYPYIVRLDGHSEIGSDYIKYAIETLIATGAVNVGGIMAAQGITPFQKAVARAMRSPLGVGNSRFHTGGEAGESDTVYLGVFRKSALEEIGGFDEKFTRAQDWELNYRLRSRGGKIWFDPRLEVTYRPRKNLRLLAKQYFEYGRWRRAVSRRHIGTVNARYLAAPLALSVNLLSVILSVTTDPIFIAPLLGYLTVIAFGSALIGKDLGERLRLPWVLMTMHMSWGLGFLPSPRRLIS